MRPLLELPTYVDVGYGCPMELSSAPSGGVARILVPSRFPGEYSFQTEHQDRPWLIVDLGVLRAAKSLRIFNYEHAPDRAIPLQISSSTDRHHWNEIATVRTVFGGQRTEAPFEIKFRDQHLLRYLKLEVERTSSLHLDYIEISVEVPRLIYGRFLNVQVQPKAIAAEYHHHESFGFSWTFTCSLLAIYLVRDYGIHVSRINYSRALAQFKDRLTDDPYLDLFEPAPELVADLPFPPHFGHHDCYATFRLADHRRYVDAYFKPSRKVFELVARWVERYRLDLQRTVVLVYRGTDKSTEVRLAPIESYIAVARHLRQRDPGLHVAIQTDQAEAREAVLAAYPDAIRLDELPVTTGSTAIHDLPVNERFGITSAELAIRLLAMTYMYSSAQYIVSHTGNIGLWLALYRGRPEGFYQFDQGGQLRDPSGALTPLDSLQG